MSVMKRWWAGRGERGGAEAVSFVLIAPALFLAVIGAMQVGVWYAAKEVVLSAAQTAADTERVAGAAGGGESAARAVAGRGDVRNVSVSVSRSPATVTVAVTGRANIFIDLPLATITQTVTVPRERVTNP